MSSADFIMRVLREPDQINVITDLIFTALKAKSIDDILTIFFLFFSLKKIGSDISCKLSPEDNLHEMLKSIFSEK